MKNTVEGITCDIFRAQNETEQFHKDIELDFVISGHIHVVVEDHEYLVSGEEFLLINSTKRRYVYVDQEAFLCRFYFQYEMLSRAFEEDYIAFWCNTIVRKDPGYEELLDLTREVIRLKVQEDGNHTFSLMEKYGRILELLTRFYRIETPSAPHRYDADDHIQEIISYINRNYQEPLTLSGLADSMYVSVSTMSRMIKKATGSKFPDYINGLRLQHAIDDLIHTNKSVTEIAIDHGFSNPSSFNRVFKEQFNTTPSQYKRNIRSTIESNRKTLTPEAATHIRAYLEETTRTVASRDPAPVLDIYTGGTDVFRNISTQTVNVGAFYQLMNSSVQDQIRQIAYLLQLKYIRLWNLFSPKCMIAIGPEEKSLSFEQIDTVFDFLISIHVHPFLDMTDHPEVVIQNGQKYFYRQDDNMGFQNREQWSSFLDKLMEHVVFRYGPEEVSEWIFEFGYYSTQATLDYYGSTEAYYKGNEYADVFETAWNIIKKHCPKTRVGGPCWAIDGIGSGEDLDIGTYLRFWESIDMIPDFYSVQMFPYMTVKGADGHYLFERNMDPDYIANLMKRFKEELKHLHAPERPVFVTETSSILSNRNAMNDHLFRATNTLRVTNLFQKDVDMLCFWVATDRLSLHYASPEILHGGSGLLSKDSLPKPTLFALYFLSKLGSDLLSKGEDYMAVQSSRNSIYILCYNHKNLKYDYKYEEEKGINKYNVNSMFVDTDPVTVRYMIHGLDAGKEYVIKTHSVNQDYGSIMDEWKRLGYEKEMRSNDIRYLRSVCVPRITMEHKVAEEGQIYLEAELKPHEMLLLHVYR